MRWSSTLSSRLGGGQVGNDAIQRAAWAQLMASSVADREILEVLQHETPVLMAFARAYSETRSAEWAATHIAEEPIV